jgi:hypothetical protein
VVEKSEKFPINFRPLVRSLRQTSNPSVGTIVGLVLDVSRKKLVYQ